MLSGFKSEARGSRLNSHTPPVPDRHQKRNRLFLPTCTHRVSGKSSYRLCPSSSRKVARPPSKLLNCAQNKEAHNDTIILKKKHTMFELYQRNRGNQTSQLKIRKKSKEPSNLVSLRSSFELPACRSRSFFLHSSSTHPSPKVKAQSC